MQVKNKMLLLVSTFLCSSLISFPQQKKDTNIVRRSEEKSACLTVGFLQGGGGIIGLDFESLVSKRVGIQAGAGIIAFGAGINYHLKPRIRSSFLSLSYWHQGIGWSYMQSIIASSIVYRGKKWLTAQIGLGYTIDTGELYYEYFDKKIPYILVFSIGIYKLGKHNS